MFTKRSRYRRVPDVAVPDVRGRLVAAKDIRPLPDVTGTFRHTVDSGDRLDQLSYRYYGDPLQYWHICDANPQYLSPLDLLDRDPLTTTRIPVAVPTGDPQWTDVVRALAGTVGVEDVTVQEDVDLLEQRQTVGGQPVTVVVRRYRRALVVVHNRLVVGPAAVVAVVAAAGFTVGASEDSGRLGQQIVIPPAVSG